MRMPATDFMLFLGYTIASVAGLLIMKSRLPQATAAWQKAQIFASPTLLVCRGLPLHCELSDLDFDPSPLRAFGRISGVHRSDNGLHGAGRKPAIGREHWNFSADRNYVRFWLNMADDAFLIGFVFPHQNRP
jgi:hypothetical protein